MSEPQVKAFKWVEISDIKHFEEKGWVRSNFKEDGPQSFTYFGEQPQGTFYLMKKKVDNQGPAGTKPTLICLDEEL